MMTITWVCLANKQKKLNRFLFKERINRREVKGGDEDEDAAAVGRVTNLGLNYISLLFVFPAPKRNWR